MSAVLSGRLLADAREQSCGFMEWAYVDTVRGGA